MPNKSKRPCSYPRCAELTIEQYCNIHKKAISKQYNQQRGSAAQRRYNSRWRKARLSYLNKHPLCVECEKHGRFRAAQVVDHILAHKGDKILFWDVNNWQPLCASCHSAKTAREDGGFGNG